jgi:hypothetical protein
LIQSHIVLPQTELLDEFSAHSNDSAISEIRHSNTHSLDVGMGHANFAWSKTASTEGSLTPSRADFQLRFDSDLIFHQNCINLVVGEALLTFASNLEDSALWHTGPTGSGKTALLMALLGEMHFSPSGPTAWINFPREGGVAYCAQEAWIQSETIKASLLLIFLNAG